jgi:hypothetical protein
MFRGELLAFVDARNPDDPNELVKAQLLVDQREVAGIRGTPRPNNPVNGWLRVSVVRSKDGWMEVVLPQPSQPLGEAILVDQGVVREEPGA